MVRVEWDEGRKVLVLGRARARLEVGPDGISGALRIERNRLRRIVVERRGFGRDVSTAILAQVRAPNGNEEQRLIDLPALAPPELETLLQRLAALDLRPLLRREYGPSPAGAREVMLSQDELRFVEGAPLPPGCEFVPAGERSAAPLVAAKAGVLGIGVVAGTLLVSGGTASLAAVLGLAGTVAGLLFVGGLVEQGSFRNRRRPLWRISPDEGLYLFDDHLLVWASQKTARIPRESFLGAQIREPLGGPGAVHLRYRKGEQTAEIDLSQFGPGRFTLSRWAELVERCAAWRGEPRL